MNARAFDQEISQVLTQAEAVDRTARLHRLPCSPTDFDYKRFPFRTRDLGSG